MESRAKISSDIFDLSREMFTSFEIEDEIGADEAVVVEIEDIKEKFDAQNEAEVLAVEDDD